MAKPVPAAVIETPEFLSAGVPLFLLTAYAKNERADLSQADRNDFRQLTKLLVANYGKARL